MGQLFHNLTSPGTGISIGDDDAVPVGSPQQTMHTANDLLRSAIHRGPDTYEDDPTAPPVEGVSSSETLDDKGNVVQRGLTPREKMDARVAAAAGEDYYQPPEDPTAPKVPLGKTFRLGDTSIDPSEAPKVTTPSFMAALKANHDGNPNAMRTMSKGGKLMAILAGGLRGGVDAVASGALNAERGKSYFGAGMQGAQEMPFIRAARQQARERGGLENELLTQNVKYGPAKLAYEMLAKQAEIGEKNASAAKNIEEAKTQSSVREKNLSEAEKSKYLETGGLIYKLQNGENPLPVGGQMVPLDPATAQYHGLPQLAGQQVPVSFAKDLTDMRDKGLKQVQSDGRVRLYDQNHNRFVDDLGKANSAVNIDNRITPTLNPDGNGGFTPGFQTQGQIRRQITGGGAGGGAGVHNTPSANNPAATGNQPIPLQGGMKTATQLAPAEGIAKSAQRVLGFAGALDNKTDRILIRKILTESPDAGFGWATLDAYVKQGLSPAGQNYLYSLKQLHEDIPGMKTLLGNSRQSDKTIQLLLGTLPGKDTPNAAQARLQLNMVLQNIRNLTARLPHLPGVAAPGGGGAGGFPRTITDNPFIHK